MIIRKGQRLRLPPIHLVDQMGMLVRGDNSCPCTVVYINRRHRYYTVVFEFSGGAVRESFKLEAGDRFE